jgi:hypothetical protein
LWMFSSTVACRRLGHQSIYMNGQEMLLVVLSMKATA